ncbi:FimV/HubP family polar landmark protein [Marinobacter antarcticus]|uniref:FimV N-terminal domain-containing protein n=1 Tax=Marinobacter antarcticus TaxID=564117 RepID=A0A831R5J3_9GAMM|nr:FimV/HubP family polar landmark protein [Marinobacter antarcticus]HEA52609.1 hypothetical protein [Marinobacter antarcticus]
MKVRKLAVALALAGGLGSGVAHSLGLGEIELQSYLNEPIDADIVLPQSQGIDPGDVFVNIAPERAYQRLGLQRNPFLGKLRFDVVTRPDGSLMVNVSSKEALKEPYLNFLLELTWPNGRLMREYAVLVDPPVYAEESGVASQVRAPSSAPSARSQPATSARSAESARRQSRVQSSRAQSSRNAGYGADTFGPTGSSDTLWTIAATVRPDSDLTTQQVMLALQDLNPDAFIGNNINRLKRGEVLRVPSADQVRKRTRAEATRAVAQQNQEFKKPKRTVDATNAQQPKSNGAGDSVAGGDELKLLVADDKGDRSKTEGGSAGGDGQLAGGADAGAAVAMEELESARRENDELSTRVDDLQDQVQTLQRLIELKNSQLADIQQGAADSAGDQAPAVANEDSMSSENTAAVDGEPDTDVEPGQEQATGSAMVGGQMEATGADGEPETATAPEAGATEADSMAPDTAESDTAAAEPMVAAGSDAAMNKPEAEAQSQTPEKVSPSEPAEPEPMADKGFPGNVIDTITNNVVYQAALGIGLILLLLVLLLLARRNASKEKAFYEQLNNETAGPEDTFDLSLDEEDAEQSDTSDVLEEADAYVAYGRYDQAAQALETAISREPSRTDLRLKLLGVYADNQDRESFEKQFGEIQALDDDAAVADANDLRSRLEEAESMPSIDDLESQLRSGSIAEEPNTVEDSGNEFSNFDSDLSDFDLDDLNDSESAGAEPEDAELESIEPESEDLIEYDLSGLALAGDEDESDDDGDTDTDTDTDTDADEPDDENDFSSLDLDFDDSEDSSEGSSAHPKEPASPVSGGASEPEPLTEGTDVDSLDESFLDELDAELDKVADEEDEIDGLEMEESTLDDLELDVSDEDLALMEEFSDSADSTNAGHDDDELPLDDELDLEDALSDNDLDDLSDDDLTDDELPIASDEVRDDAPKSPIADIDENDLGDDDDDFDFLAGTDEAATKLDLARAYIEMGDSDGARDILEEVALEGDDEQKTEAQDLLKNLS